MANEYRASHKHARISPRKARYVMDLVRNQKAEAAIEMLSFTHRRAAPMISKVIRSAMANAVQEGAVEAENLVIAQAYVDEGPTGKRWRPRARGMAFPIMKRTSHLNVVLTEQQSKKRSRDEAAASDDSN
ncbi:MAG: 50S ribosomal protein L22 [Planctomycetota bacterium]